jgi:hypothetical protein
MLCGLTPSSVAICPSPGDRVLLLTVPKKRAAFHRRRRHHRECRLGDGRAVDTRVFESLEVIPCAVRRVRDRDRTAELDLPIIQMQAPSYRPDRSHSRFNPEACPWSHLQCPRNNGGKFAGRHAYQGKS